MFLYKFELVKNDENVAHLIVAANDDQKAFEYAESELDKQFMAGDVKEIVLLQKKRCNNGTAYIISA
ncbi:DUF3906 family protein [Longirhabdus pacifica]|uniref:DUF3906 family protein n=1 Tax=Longirhabdus pacifica TaxID=2305227 RepID=UPI001008C175|nr:DUF3906 family protein [Longirhabdus pacifica]